MAARVLLSRRSLAPLATLALGGMALTPATVFAEGPSNDFKRKPIYDDLDLPSSNPAPATPPPAYQPSQPAEEKHRSGGPSLTDQLAVEIGKVRMALYQYAVATENKVNQTMDSAFNLEQSFTSTIASLAPSRESGEQLMPGAIYVLVAAMAGSIITRNRNIVLRATLPLALGIGAGWTVIPITMRNVSDLTWKYEQRFPVIAESHVRLRESLLKGVSFAKVHSALGARYVDEKVTDARETVEGWVQKGK
ncbi:apolipo protein O-domain-containing protein [Dactylonectria estremocensis]|uniref:MICOS complex subunit n=1 Tax=Dactylonectria estremocensis TaxID=1079267 RepID=A0A9P9JDQ6_9HYPO|nr:apolipo protein O-domain-containing protein [Dactylonectria estremocensis]